MERRTITGNMTVFVSHCREGDQFKLGSKYSNLLAKYTLEYPTRCALQSSAGCIQFWKREKKIALGFILFFETYLMNRTFVRIVQ